MKHTRRHLTTFLKVSDTAFRYLIPIFFCLNVPFPAFALRAESVKEKKVGLEELADKLLAVAGPSNRPSSSLRTGPEELEWVIGKLEPAQRESLLSWLEPMLWDEIRPLLESSPTQESFRQLTPLLSKLGLQIDEWRSQDATNLSEDISLELRLALRQSLLTPLEKTNNWFLMLADSLNGKEGFIPQEASKEARKALEELRGVLRVLREETGKSIDDLIVPLGPPRVERQPALSVTNEWLSARVAEVPRAAHEKVKGMVTADLVRRFRGWLAKEIEDRNERLPWSNREYPVPKTDLDLARFHIQLEGLIVRNIPGRITVRDAANTSGALILQELLSPEAKEVLPLLSGLSQLGALGFRERHPEAAPYIQKNGVGPLLAALARDSSGLEESRGAAQQVTDSLAVLFGRQGYLLEREGVGRDWIRLSIESQERDEGAQSAEVAFRLLSPHGNHPRFEVLIFSASSPDFLDGVKGNINAILDGRKIIKRVSLSKDELPKGFQEGFAVTMDGSEVTRWQSLSRLTDDALPWIKEVTDSGSPLVVVIHPALIKGERKDLSDALGNIARDLRQMRLYPAVTIRLSPARLTAQEKQSSQIIHLERAWPDAPANKQIVYVQPSKGNPLPIEPELLPSLITEAVKRWQEAQGQSVLSEPIYLPLILYGNIRGLSAKAIWDILTERFA